MPENQITLNSLSREQMLSLLNELAIKNSNAREIIFSYIQKLNENNIAEQNENIVNRKSSPEEKIKLFMKLLNGRNDVYAQRWQNKEEKSGYSPVCKNRFAKNKCNLKIGCGKCPFREFIPLTENAVFNHLRGEDSFCRDVIGMYTIFPDSTCTFLVLDFDEEDFKNDVTAIRKTCEELTIPCSVEISRSGNGAHIWFFFSDRIAAKIAREFGSYIIKFAMTKRHEISFSSFDRMFPNQDEIPEGGFGNLIALPLQGQAVRKNASVFVDESFSSFPDQWKFLSGIKKISLTIIERTIREIKFKLPEESHQNNNEIDFASTSKIEFPSEIKIILSNKIYISKTNFTEQSLGQLKRLAVFHNPQFYERQKMRLPTYNIPHYIDCSEEDKEFLVLPRGCFDDIRAFVEKSNCKIQIEDKRQSGKKINTEFIGELGDEQNFALNALLQSENGVLLQAPVLAKQFLLAPL